MKNAVHVVALCIAMLPTFGIAAEPSSAYPVAIFDFVEKGRGLSGMGEKVGTVLFSRLVAEPGITLVDREEIGKLEDEAALSLSGMVDARQAVQVGQLTGARIVVTGTVFEIEDKLMLVAKVIGTETSRVHGASVEGDVTDDVLNLTKRLAGELARVITEDSGSLVAPPVKSEDRLAALEQQLDGTDKPTLVIDITEHHVDRAAADPAAETELIYYSRETGFDVIESGSARAGTADILISGEGFTEQATRRGEIVGVKARLEVKAIDQATQRILAVDRQTELEIDVSEMIAAKEALRRASAKVAERLLPRLVNVGS